MKEYVNTFMHYRFLLGELVKKGIKLKYRRSYLGIIWSLLGAVAYHDGTDDRIRYPVWKQGSDISCIYPDRTSAVQLFYSSSTTAALKSVRANSAMIKKVYVPKYIYPLSSVLYNYVIFLISLIVLAIR